MDLAGRDFPDVLQNGNSETVMTLAPGAICAITESFVVQVPPLLEKSIALVPLKLSPGVTDRV
jgi:hypothetical protein